jgi:single-stranded DNA-specific DHH superfamily exonuclease
LTEDDLTPALGIDAEVTARDLSVSAFAGFASFEPFGAGNPRPVFMTRACGVLAAPR